MGRNFSISSRERLAQAIAYLRRAHERNGTEFFVNAGQARGELSKLEDLMARQKDADITGVFSAWLDAHVTELGRARLLATLRRKRADSSPGRKRRRSVLLPDTAYRELELLSKSIGGVPLPRLIASFAAIANVDRSLREQLVKVAVSVEFV